jgi:hypothetical protein
VVEVGLLGESPVRRESRAEAASPAGTKRAGRRTRRWAGRAGRGRRARGRRRGASPSARRPGRQLSLVEPRSGEPNIPQTIRQIVHILSVTDNPYIHGYFKRTAGQSGLHRSLGVLFAAGRKRPPLSSAHAHRQTRRVCSPSPSQPAPARAWLPPPVSPPTSSLRHPSPAPPPPASFRGSGYHSRIMFPCGFVGGCRSSTPHPFELPR